MEVHQGRELAVAVRLGVQIAEQIFDEGELGERLCRQVAHVKVKAEIKYARGVPRRIVEGSLAELACLKVKRLVFRCQILAG